MINEELVQEAYVQWMCHPVTNLFQQVLKKHEELLSQKIVVDATNASISDQQVRWNAVSLKDSVTISAILNNFEMFKKMLQIK